MKKMKYLVTILLLSLVITGYSQIKDKEAILKKAFETLKNNDEAGFIKLFPDILTMRSFMSSVELKDTSEDKDRRSALFETMTDSIFQIQFTRMFKGAMKKAAKRGVDWSTAKWGSFTAEIDSVSEGIMKTAALEGNIYFTAGGKEYFIRYDDVVWFDNKGWYGISIKNIEEKGKHEDQGIIVDMGESDEMEMSDSATVVVDTLMFSDSVAVAVDEIPKAKPKAPVKSKPAQKKTQPPARKPE